MPMLLGLAEFLPKIYIALAIEAVLLTQFFINHIAFHVLQYHKCYQFYFMFFNTA